MGCDGEEKYLGGKEEAWGAGCGSLDTFLVTGEDAFEDVDDGDEEAKDGGDGDVGCEDGISEAED